MPRRGYSWDNEHRANWLASRDAAGFAHILAAITDIQHAEINGTARQEAAARLRYGEMVLADLERNLARKPRRYADPYETEWATAGLREILAELRVQVKARVIELARADASAAGGSGPTTPVPSGPNAPPFGGTRHAPVPTYTHHAHLHAAAGSPDATDGLHSHVHEHAAGTNNHINHSHPAV